MIHTNHESPESPEKKERAEKLSITLPRKTIEQVDEMRGDVPRSKFVYRSLVDYLSKKKALLVAIPIWLMVMTAASAAATGGTNAHIQTVQCADMTHGCGPGCDFGYHWNTGLQTCTPILNPNSDIQQPNIQNVGWTSGTVQ